MKISYEGTRHETVTQAMTYIFSIHKWVSPSLLSWPLSFGNSDPLPTSLPSWLLLCLAVFIWSPASYPPGPAGSLWHPVSHTWAEHRPGFCALWHGTSAGLWHVRKTPGDHEIKDGEGAALEGFFCSAVQKYKNVHRPSATLALHVPQLLVSLGSGLSCPNRSLHPTGRQGG